MPRPCGHRRHGPRSGRNGGLGHGSQPEQQKDGDNAQGHQHAPIVADQALRNGSQEQSHRNEDRGQAGEHAALSGRDELLDIGDGDDVQAAYADAHTDAQDGQQDPGTVRQEDRQSREDHEAENTPLEGMLAAEAIGQTPPEDGSDDCAQPGAGQDDSSGDPGQVPGRSQEGDHEADQEHIEEFGNVAGYGQADDAFLMSGQGAGVYLLVSGQRLPGLCDMCITHNGLLFFLG